MNCPLTLYYTGTTGTEDFYAPCECDKLCAYTKCRYGRCGFLVQFSSLGTTTGNIAHIIGKRCGGSAPLVAASTGDPVANSAITANTVYRIYPQTINNVLRFIVAGL